MQGCSMSVEPQSQPELRCGGEYATTDASSSILRALRGVRGGAEERKLCSDDAARRLGDASGVVVRRKTEKAR